MIEGARRLPLRHVTIRTPWHDNGWTGRVCSAPEANTSCLALSRIAKSKPSDLEERAGASFLDLDETWLPPCVDERVSFMLGQDLILSKNHPYRERSPDTHGHFAPTKLRLLAYSAACIPFSWMLSRHVEGDEEEVGSAHRLKLGYSPEREPELGFTTSWIQDRSNQLVMLDTFFSALKKRESLCFFYAKKTPLSESSRRVIIGVGRVEAVGPHTDYETTGPGPLDSVLWERCVRHSIRPDGEDGFLMPYAEALAAAEADPTYPLESCVAFAPDEQFESYSYASEHLSHDGAIASLLACASALRAMEERSETSFRGQLSWIDRELNRLWGARGVHPGLGSALSAFGLEYGTLIAFEIEHRGATPGTPFDAFAFIDQYVSDPALHPELEALGFGATFREKWLKLPGERRRLLDLIARCDLSAQVAGVFYQPSLRAVQGVPASDADLLSNPYLIFELGHRELGVAFGAVDRGVFPPESIRKGFSLPAPSAMSDAIDPRRVRALAVDILWRAAMEEGHTLLPEPWLVRRCLEAPLDPPCPADEDTFAMAAEHLQAHVQDVQNADGTRALKLNWYGDARDLISRAVKKRVAGARHELSLDWRKLVDAAIDKPLPQDTAELQTEQQGRTEKSDALRELVCSRLSVLIGPAGSGKTTLLRTVCDLPTIGDRVLLLAPTGKARVRLEEATNRLGQAKTLAQFLQRWKRYDGATQRYFWNPDAPRENGYSTVIVDECSMLTEDQLAALFDAVEGVQRFILVGDPRQLPPIGAGRPFFDICAHLALESATVFPRVARGYAELTTVRRQQGEGRDDVLLARQFSGDSLDPGADEVWDRLAEGALDNVKAVKWNAPRTLSNVLFSELVDELGLSGPDDEAAFECSLGGTPYEETGGIFFWAGRDGAPGAASKSHAWQILSPVRAGLAGVDVLNQETQRRFRKGWTSKAQQRGAKVPPPAGPQGLVYGDKVINVRNNGRRRTYPKVDGAYVANGDLGIVVGGYRTGKMKYRPRDLEVEFHSQAGVKFTYWSSEFTGDDADPQLELAYALTVHKTQGSQFGRTFVVVPRNCRPLSRELLYTALTRHEDHLTLLHEEPVGELRRFTHPSESEIARRMTDLFSPPRPIEVLTYSGQTFLDANLIHRTSRNELVRSKSELAIAEKLIARNVPYSYEQPIQLAGKTRYPDFTITDDDTGVTVYWEHLGMLGDPTYKARWEAKLADYAAEGILPWNKDAPAARVLVTTEDGLGSGLDMLRVDAIISEVLCA